jgi:GGDEF domain-containing protein
MATFWAVEPMLIVLQVIPLVLFFRALRVPKLQEEADHDAKTGLLGARRFMELLNLEIEKSLRTSRPLSVLMCDLDLFRNVNNSYGHLAGDEVLKAVADLLQRTFRDEDLSVASEARSSWYCCEIRASKAPRLRRTDSARCAMLTS